MYFSLRGLMMTLYCCRFRLYKMCPRHVEKWTCITVHRCAITLSRSSMSIRTHTMTTSVCWLWWNGLLRISLTSFYCATACNVQRMVLLLEFCTSVSNVCVMTKRSNCLSIYKHRVKEHPLCFLLQQQLLGIFTFHLKYWLKLTHPLQKRPTSTYSCS